MREHRVPLRGLSRYPDPAQSGDPRIRELVTALATLDPAPAPRAHFRAELRAQLVAVAPRLVAEGEPAGVSPAAANEGVLAAGTRRDRLGRLAGFRLGRPLLVVAGLAAAFIMLLGGSVLLSRNAVPGDTLYDVKRASEDVQMAMTTGAVDRGSLSLTFAAHRIDEVRALLPQVTSQPPGSAAPVPPSDRTVALVSSTLDSADGDVHQAAQLLGGAAVSGRNAGPLRTELTWLPAQLDALSPLVDALPAGALQDRIQASLQLLQQAQARAQALLQELGCSCLDGASTDALGPVPCAGCGALTGGIAPAVPGVTPLPPGVTGSGTGGSGGVPVPPARGTTAPAGGPSTSSTHHERHNHRGTGGGTGTSGGGATSGGASTQAGGTGSGGRRGSGGSATTGPSLLPKTLPSLLPTKLPPKLPIKLPTAGLPLPTSSAPLPLPLPTSSLPVTVRPPKISVPALPGVSDVTGVLPCVPLPPLTSCP